MHYKNIYLEQKTKIYPKNFAKSGNHIRILVLVAESEAIAQTGGIAHYMGQQILLHDATEQMRLRAHCKHDHILARMHALSSMNIAGCVGCWSRIKNGLFEATTIGTIAITYWDSMSCWDSPDVHPCPDSATCRWHS